MLAPKTCPGCGSADLGRGRCRTAWHEALRDLTPLRRWRCRACAREGWTARPLPRSQHPEEQGRVAAGPRAAGRPAEPRDAEARWQALVRAALAVLLALVLGVVVANRLVSCQGQAPAPAAE